MDEKGSKENAIPSNRRWSFWAGVIWLVITARMIPVAIEHNQWREFAVTQIALLASLVAVYRFLDDKSDVISK